MRAIISIIFGFFALTSSLAKADNQPLVFGQGTYCSATATDGIWAFAWGNTNVFTNCNLVRNSIATRTGAPIDRSLRGYYWLTGYNAVSVTCLGGSASFTGFGAIALQNAYNYTVANNGRGCLFSVN